MFLLRKPHRVNKVRRKDCPGVHKQFLTNENKYEQFQHNGEANNELISSRLFEVVPVLLVCDNLHMAYRIHFHMLLSMLCICWFHFYWGVAQTSFACYYLATPHMICAIVPCVGPGCTLDPIHDWFWDMCTPINSDPLALTNKYANANTQHTIHIYCTLLRGTDTYTIIRIPHTESYTIHTHIPTLCLRYLGHALCLVSFQFEPNPYQICFLCGVSMCVPCVGHHWVHATHSGEGEREGLPNNYLQMPNKY